MSPAAAVRRRRRLPWWAWALAALGALVLVVALLGGFGTVPVERVRLVQQGEVVQGTEIDLSVTGVSIEDRMPGASAPSEGEEVLVVAARLVNRADVPSTLLGDRIRVIAGEVGIEDRADRVLETRGSDADFVDFLQPGLPTDLLFAWPVETGSLEPGEEVVIGVLDRIPISDDPIYGDTAYSAPRAIARLVVPLGDR